MKTFYLLTPFDNQEQYAEQMHQVLEELLRGESVERLGRLLPLVKWGEIKEPPFHLSFKFCAPFRNDLSRFVLEMVVRGLLPPKRLESVLQFSLDFTLPEYGTESYTGGEIRVCIHTKEELKTLQKNLPSLEKRMKIGLLSEHMGNYFLESLSDNHANKMGETLENLRKIIKLRPQNFDYDLFDSLRRFSVMSSSDFQQNRSHKHLSRIVCVHYLFQKTLKMASDAFPDRRYVSVKLSRLIYENKKRVSLVIALSFLRENEIFEERHIVSAIRMILKSAHVVEGSFLILSPPHDPIKTFYLEIENENKIPFPADEIMRLKSELPNLLKNHIEERLNSLLVRENEEEILRHILALSHQVRSIRDVPQVIIHFHKQTAHELEFMLVMVRVINDEAPSAEELFAISRVFRSTRANRTKVLGFLRKNYKKEASVFHVSIDKEPFIRQDHAIDLYKAREVVSKELEKVIGTFRDFNGGFISKEGEQFLNLRSELGVIGREHSLLLENFFFSLSPAVMRSVLPIEPLKKLFYLLIEGKSEELNKGEEYLYRFHEEGEYFYLQLIMKTKKQAEKVLSFLEKEAKTLELTTCFLETSTPTIGLIAHKGEGKKNIGHALEKIINSALNY